MKLINKGKYEGKVEEFASAKKVKGAVKYKEAGSILELIRILRKPQTILTYSLLAVVLLVINKAIFDNIVVIYSYIGAYFLSLLLLIPHEVLHAICYRGNVYLYYSLSNFALFIVGEEHISKARFIFMSLLPNIIFGFIPYIIFFFKPDWYVLGFLGVFNISAGIGDYYNVYNTIRQVPNGALVFMCGENTYWYLSNK